MTEPHRRRATDRVAPDVMLAISEQAAENRHTLRGEMAEALVRLEGTLSIIRQNMETDNLARVGERAEIRAAVADIKDDVSSLKDTVSRLEPRVVSLEAKSLAADAVANLTARFDTNRRWLVASVVLPTLAIVVSVVLFLALHH